MRLDLDTSELHSSNGELLAEFDGYVHNNWDALSWTKSEFVRFCGVCQKEVLNITSFSEPQIKALLQLKPDVCIYFDENKLCESIEVVGDFEENVEKCHSCNNDNAPVIVAARDLEAMTRAEQMGYKLAIVAVDILTAPSRTVRLSKNMCGGYEVSSVFEENSSEVDTITPHIDSVAECMLVKLAGSSLSEVNKTTNSQLLINSYHPFLAYIIPPEIKDGTRVYLTDIIDNIADERWPENYQPRLNSGYAMYVGNTLLLENPHPIELD
ncbi:hypothetical protein [Photobacterium kagoshimensis]|uniref:hypothetical protein n=1 Tax=Photobacterium kagoshimensis TaxID=2910242 RepID=UPI003D12E281